MKLGDSKLPRRGRLATAIAVPALIATLVGALVLVSRSPSGKSPFGGPGGGLGPQTSGSAPGQTPTSPTPHHPVTSAATEPPWSHGRTSASAPASSSPASSGASPAPSGVPSQSELDSALLTAAQVGPGFTRQPADSGISESSLTSACPAVGGASPSEMAMASFVANPGSLSITEVTEELLQFTPGQAVAQLNQFAQVAMACPEFSIVIPTAEGNIPAQIAVIQEALSGIGDQDAAIQITADLTTPLGEVTLSGDIVAVRLGGTVILVVNAAVQLDTDLTNSVLSRAYEQVAARW